jgi:hypothetical protein
VLSMSFLRLIGTTGKAKYRLVWQAASCQSHHGQVPPHHKPFTVPHYISFWRISVVPFVYSYSEAYNAFDGEF